MTRTAFGLKLQIRRRELARRPSRRPPCREAHVATFALSAALAGIAGAVELLGVQGTIRADWNPAYGLLVVPLVFLARFPRQSPSSFHPLLCRPDDRRDQRLASGRRAQHFVWFGRDVAVVPRLVEYLDHRWRRG